jgi:hypothetical protein
MQESAFQEDKFCIDTLLQMVAGGGTAKEAYLSLIRDFYGQRKFDFDEKRVFPSYNELNGFMNFVDDLVVDIATMEMKLNERLGKTISFNDLLGRLTKEIPDYRIQHIEVMVEAWGDSRDTYNKVLNAGFQICEEVMSGLKMKQLGINPPNELTKHGYLIIFSNGALRVISYEVGQIQIPNKEFHGFYLKAREISDHKISSTLAVPEIEAEHLKQELMSSQGITDTHTAAFYCQPADKHLRYPFKETLLPLAKRRLTAELMRNAA